MIGADIFEHGVLQAVSGRAVEYIGDRTRDKTARRWNTAQCHGLAYMARELLDGRKKLLRAFGHAAAAIVSRANGNHLPNLLAFQLGKALRFP